MTYRYNLAAVLSAVVLLCCATLILGPKVNAAGDSKITGTVKLDGAAPHMRGIDMSKDPFCSKAHASDPAHLETVVVGQGGGLENVALYISGGSTGSALTQVPTSVPVFDQKGCVYSPHVLAMDVNQNFKVATSDQTAHNIHPNPNPMTGNIPWNLSQPPGAPRSRRVGRPRKSRFQCSATFIPGCTAGSLWSKGLTQPPTVTATTRSKTCRLGATP